MTLLERLKDRRTGRLLALVVAGLLAVLLWAGLISPLVQWAAGDHPLILSRRVLAEQRRIAERLPRLQSEKLDLEHAGPARTEFLSGATPALAAAELQSQLAALVKPLGGAVASVEPLTLPDEEGFHRAGLRAKLALRQDALPPLLRAIESAAPRLIVNSIAIKASEGELAITLELYGYLS